MSTSFLVELQKPEVRKRFDSRPIETRKLIAGVAFEREVKPKFDKLKLTPEELQQAKQKFVDRYTGQDTGPLPKDFGMRSEEAKPTAPINQGIPALRGGVMRGVQRVSNLAGMLPNQASEFLGQAAEGYEKAAEPYAKEHPYKSGALEFVGQSVPGLALEELPVVAKGGKFLKSAAGMLPFSKTGTEWLAGTGIGVGLGAVWNKFFGPKGIKVAEETAKKGFLAKKAVADTVADAERRAIYADFGVVDASKTVAELHKANPTLVPKVSERLDALSAAKKEAEATAAKEAKSLQAAEKEGLKAQERAGKATEAFVKQFGHAPSSDQMEGLKAGGAKLLAVIEDEKLLQKQLKTARNLLTAKRLQLIRKASGKIPGESEITQVRDAIKTMSIDDINKEMEMYKKAVKPQAAPTPKTTETKSPTIQEQTQAKLSTDVQTPELAASRPDIVKATDQADSLVQPPEAAKPREPFVVKLAGKDVTVLTDEEARQPGAGQKAYERISAAAREFIQAEKDERKQGPVVNKAIKLIEYLKQGGMDERLQKEGVAVFDDLGKPAKSSSGAKIGRPTKAEAAEKSAAVRAQETAEREAAALQEKRNEANYAKASGKEISASQINASGESRTSPTGGSGRLSSYNAFEEIYGRPAEAGEAFMLESGHSPVEAVDEAIQDAFERSKEK